MIQSSASFDDFKFDWNNSRKLGEGWVAVPFTFDAEVFLQFHVFRGESFSVPDWVHVDIGDFDDHYFPASGYKTLTFSASVSAQFSEEEIEERELPNDLEVDDIELAEPFSE